MGTEYSQPLAGEGSGGFGTPRAVGVAGLLFAAFFTASLLLGRPPGGATPASLQDWYSGSALSTLVLVGLYGIPLAGIAFLWFIGAVRARLVDQEDRFFSTIFLGSGLLFVAMLFAGVACGTALALRFDIPGFDAPFDAESLRFAWALAYAFIYVYAARAAGVFMLTTSTIVLRAKSAPRWVAYVGYAIAALLLLSIRYFQLIILLFPAWVALVSVIILVKPAASRDASV